MTSFVLDSSVALAWCFRSERTPETARLLAEVSDRGAWVPDLWYLEVSNVLMLAQRRRRIDETEMREALALLGGLPIERDPLPAQQTVRQTLALAISHSLTTYDAAYLELAIRRNLPLATRDADLQAAARACAIPLALEPT